MIIEEELKKILLKKNLKKQHGMNCLNNTVQKIPDAVQPVETVNKLSIFVVPYLI